VRFRISTILPTHWRSAYGSRMLANALHGCALQRHGRHYVYVVCDPPTYESKGCVLRHLTQDLDRAKLRWLKNNVRWIYEDAPYIGQKRNLGAELAIEDGGLDDHLIRQSDDDDYYGPWCCRSLELYMATHPECLGNWMPQDGRYYLFAERRYAIRRGMCGSAIHVARASVWRERGLAYTHQRDGNGGFVRHGSDSRLVQMIHERLTEKERRAAFVHGYTENILILRLGTNGQHVSNSRKTWAYELDDTPGRDWLFSAVNPAQWGFYGWLAKSQRAEEERACASVA